MHHRTLLRACRTADSLVGFLTARLERGTPSVSLSRMDPSFWLGRWERGETGWHQTEVEPGLVEHFPKGAARRVLVPLCGKTLDLQWLASQGHEVVGVELSEVAVRAFMSEHQLNATESREGPFLIFRAGRITIFQGDIFSLTPDQLGPIDAIYDRAALIALPPELRKAYAAQILKLIAACASPQFSHLQIVLQRTPQDEQGPPFSIQPSEIETLHGHQMTCELLSREELGMRDDSKIEECIYRLEVKR